MFRKLVVDTIVKESTTIKSFYLKPSNGRVLKPYLPGQFVPVRIPLDTESIIRNYTISDWPGNDHYRITVKRENRGKASRYLHDNVKIVDHDDRWSKNAIGLGSTNTGYNSDKVKNNLIQM